MAVLELEDAKAYLNIKGVEQDVALQAIIDAAVQTIANRVGPLEPTTVTSRVYGAGDVVVLPHAPLVSLTSIGPVGGDVLDVADLTVDLTSGLLTRTDSYGFLSGEYDVTYVAGWTTVPADLLLAVKEQVRHLWGPQRGPRQTTASTDPVTPGYLMPNMVRSLIEPYRTPGVA